MVSYIDRLTFCTYVLFLYMGTWTDAPVTFGFASICTRQDPRTFKSLGFTPEVEDEVIRDAVLHRLDIPLVNPSNKVWRDSRQTQTLSPNLQIGDSVIYTKMVHNQIVQLVYINTNDPKSKKYIINLLCGNTKVVIKELLKSSNITDISSILIYYEYYINKSKNLKQGKTQNIVIPEVLSPLQK